MNHLWMSLAWLGLLVVLAGLGFFLAVLRPPMHPRGIPAVPFWVTLIPFVRDVDQAATFERYLAGPLRRHGAVKIFFGARWNVLVHRPRYVAALFRRENDLFPKSGNQQKIPHSLLAALLGDNIISSHGDAWRAYKAVIQPGLQRPFAVASLARNAAILADLIEASTATVEIGGGGGGGGVPVQDLLQRYTIANIGQEILQTEFHSLECADAPIHTQQKALKLEIFNPVFLNFPFLDRLPLPGRRAARRLIAAFKDEMVASLERSHEKAAARPPCSSPSSLDTGSNLGTRLLTARHTGQWNETQFRDNLAVLYVAGQENPQIALISTLYLLAKHPDVQGRLWAEVHAAIAAASGPSSSLSSSSSSSVAWVPEAAALQALPYLSSVVYESLRVLPPLSQLINRRTAVDVALDDDDDDLRIPAGTYVGYHCYSTHRDAAAWGPDAAAFRPERWGTTSDAVQRLYRRRRAAAEFLSFHGGNRACLGERFALLELKATLFVLVRRFQWGLDPTWPDRMTPAGPLFPRNLHLAFKKRDEIPVR